MVNILLCGCQGNMGKMITQTASERSDLKIIAGVDIKNDLSTDYPIYNNIFDVKEKADVIIDFSHPSLLSGIIEYATSNSIPVIFATTGYSQQDIVYIKKTSLNIPTFFTANMSLGINLLKGLVTKAAKTLGDGFDIEIIEKHHNKKIDSPSGTALLLADAINDNNQFEYIYDRQKIKQARTKKEIGISSVRGGTIVGEHSVIFAGTDEVIELKHSAYSKRVFAVGALNAAIWLANKEPGLYSMENMI